MTKHDTWVGLPLGVLALVVCRAFAQAAGAALNPQLRTIVTPLSKLSLKSSWRDDVMAILQVRWPSGIPSAADLFLASWIPSSHRVRAWHMQEIEELGGKEAYTAIKSKVPTYVSINI